MRPWLKWSNRPVIIYTILFGILSMFIFAPYYFTDTSLIWQSDGIAQHFPALVHWQEDLKNIVHNHTLPTNWQWQIGLGADYYQTFSYYTLGDIFSYGAVLVSKAHLIAYYNWMVIVRLYLAGIAFLLTAQHWFKNRPTWHYQIAVFGYIFSGYTAFSAFEHPFFINPLIIFPLLILALDIALSKQKYSFLTIVLFWTLWNNFYFAFMMMIGLGIYCLGYHIKKQSWPSWRTFIKTLLSGLIASLLAAPLLLPSVDAVLNSARSNSSIANGLTVYPAYYYFSLPGNLIANQATPSFWLTGGFTAISIMAIVFGLRRWQQYRLFNYLWLASLISLCFPIFAAIFNGGSSPSNRWLFLLSLPISLMVLHLMAQLHTLNKQDYLSFFITGVLASLSLFVISNFNLNSRYGMMIALYFASLALLWLMQSNVTLKPVWLVLLVMFNAFFLVTRNHTSNTNPKATDLLPNQVVKQLLHQQNNYKNQNDKQISRSYVDNQLNNATGIAPATNLPLLSRLNNVESYWSLQSGSVSHGLAPLGISSSNPNDITGDLDSRNIISNVLGVSDRYENPDTLTPNSYQTQTNQIVNGQTINHSENAYPLVYLPDYYLSQKYYNTLSPTEKEASMADSVVLPGHSSSDKSKFSQKVATGLIRTDLTKKAKKKQHITYKTNTDWLPEGFYLSPSKTLKGTELHLEISNIHFKPYHLKQQQQVALNQYRYQHTQDARNAQNLIDRQYNEQAFTWNWYKKNFSGIGKEINNYTISTNYNGINNTFTQTGKSNLSFYNPKKNITLNLGQANSVNKETFIPLSFDKVGQYDFDLQVKAIPTGKSFNKVAKHMKQTAPSYTLDDNQLSTSVTVDKPRILATTIPYSHGWTAKGTHANLIKLGNGFIGIPLTAGKNNINLSYHTPGGHLGKVSFFIGLLIICLTFIVRLFKRLVMSQK